MLISFFSLLRDYEIPVSIRELIDFLAVMKSERAWLAPDRFYLLSRMALVKDEKYYDRFDRAMSHYFDGVDTLPNVFLDEDVRDALLAAHGKDRAEVERLLREYDEAVPDDADEASPAAAEVLDGEQDEAGRDPGEQRDPGETGNAAEEEGGDGGEGEGGDGDDGESGDSGDGEDGTGDGGEKGEGDAGDEGEGNDGRLGIGVSETGESGERDAPVREQQLLATRVWEERRFADYDEKRELGTRNFKVALRRLRRFVRQGAEDEFDLRGTISATARNGGLLDIRTQPPRHNNLRILMFLDVGGSMDPHVEICAQLFSASRSELAWLDFYYFHNFVYQAVWQDNQRRQEDVVRIDDLLQRFSSDYRIVFVGDARMGRQEITDRGGSVESYNAVPGEVVFDKLLRHFDKVAWLNPVEERHWDAPSTQLIKRLLDDRMYTLDVDGITRAAKSLAR